MVVKDEKTEDAKIQTKFLDFVHGVDYTPLHQLYSFFQWVYRKGMLKQTTEIVLDRCLEEKKILIPPLSKNGITIGVKYDPKTTIIGINPSECYTDPTECSILAIFPLSKEKYRQFINLLDDLMQGKSTNAVIWKQDAFGWKNGAYELFAEDLVLTHIAGKKRY